MAFQVLLKFLAVFSEYNFNTFLDIKLKSKNIKNGKLNTDQEDVAEKKIPKNSSLPWL